MPRRVSKFHTFSIRSPKTRNLTAHSPCQSYLIIILFRSNITRQSKRVLLQALLTKYVDVRKLRGTPDKVGSMWEAKLSPDMNSRSRRVSRQYPLPRCPLMPDCSNTHTILFIIFALIVLTTWYAKWKLYLAKHKQSKKCN